MPNVIVVRNDYPDTASLERVENEIEDVKKIPHILLDDYKYAAALSDDYKIVFVRKA